MPDRLRTILRGIGITGATSVLLGIGSTAWLAVPLVSVASCSNQGEGDRCALFSGSTDAAANGSSECASGLVCTSAKSAFASTASLGNPSELGICCPPPGTASSSPACKSAAGGSTTGGPPEGDGSFDGATDASTDAPPSDAADARADASSRDATVTDAPTDSSTTDGAASTDAQGDALPDSPPSG